MRPASNALRYAYRAAAAKLKAEDRVVTIRSLADEVGEKFKTAQRFVYLNPEIAREIGVEVELVRHDVQEYVAAIKSIPSGVRPTARRIADHLKLDHSSVSRFLKNHPELCELHPRFSPVTPVEGEVEFEDVPFVPEEVPDEVLVVDEVLVEVAKGPEMIEVRAWRDLYVSFWEEGTGRYVGNSVSRSDYLKLWEKKLLKHQREQKPKPEHLPTPDQVATMR